MRQIIFMVLAGAVALGAHAEEALSDEYETAKAHILETLKDPDSAQFKNFRDSTLHTGAAVVCVEVNAKNSYGGYGGYKTVLVRDDYVLSEGDRRKRELLGNEIFSKLIGACVI